MSTELVFPAQVILGLVTMGLLARWFVAPRLAKLPRESALQPLLAVHTLRYIGLVFLAPAATGSSLAQSFAVPAGLGPPSPACSRSDPSRCSARGPRWRSR